MRTFISIDLPNEIKNKILSIITNCKKIDKNLKYVSLENLHITLKFLGEINENIVNSLINNLKSIRFNKFEVIIKGIGGFPDLKFPKVLWIGINNNNYLKELYSQIENITFKFGIEKEEKDFNPHITIARVKNIINKDLINYLNSVINYEFGKINVYDFVLYKSDLQKEGPVYTKLETFTLI